MTLVVRMPHVFGPRWSEWLGAMAAIGSGIGLLHPFPAFRDNSAFDLFQWAPEWLWGMALLAIGLLRLTGLIINGRRKKATSWIRYLSAFICFMIFFGFSAGLLMSGVVSTWPGAWPVFAVNEFVNMMRASQDARIGYDKNVRP